MMSVAVTAMICGASMMMSSGSAFSGRFNRPKPPPMCMHGVIPLSSMAAKIGSKWPVAKLGRPSPYGVSGMLIALQPLAPMRCTSATARSMS